MIALLSVFAISASAVGTFDPDIARQFQNSVLTDASTSPILHGSAVRGKIGAKPHHSSISALIAQLVVPPEIYTPITTCVYAPQEKPVYDAEMITQENSIWAAPGGEFEVTIYAKNTGDTPWFSDKSDCPGVNYMRLGTTRDRDRDSVFYNPGDGYWLNVNRIMMNESRINPGEIATFTINSKAPKIESDAFREYFAPVLDGGKWFEDKSQTAQVDIYVGTYSEETDKALSLLRLSAQASSIDLSNTPFIDVSIKDQLVRLMVGDTVAREYLVSTGAVKTPTPKGTFSILLKQELRIGGAAPHYHMPKFMGFTRQGAGFHALPYLANDRGVFWNEALNHIGHRVSHGCIRLLPDDAAELFDVVEVGTNVVVHD